MAEFIPGIKCDYGPYMMVPLLLPGFPTYQNRPSSGDYTREFESRFLQWDMAEDYANVLKLGPAPWSVTTGWLDACGFKLYTVDGFGTKTDTGYDIIWQYRVEQINNSGSTTVHYFIGLRIIRRKRDLSGVTVLGVITNMELGYLRDGPTAVSVGFTYREQVYNNKKYYSFGFTQNQMYGGSLIGNWVMIGISESYFTTNHYYMPVRVIEDPNEQDPDYPSKPGGGGGKFNRSSDPIAVPGLPGVEGIDCGLMTLYYGNSQVVHAFLSNIWVTSIADAIKQFFQQPMDFIIGAMILPLASQLTAAKVGDAHPVFNNIPFEGSLPYVTTQYYEVDLGVIEIEEYWGSCFDYDPYTKIQIFLPYIGYRELLADEVVGHNIYCKYHIDACTGDCVAFVGVSAVGPEGPDVERILGQFNGNCGVKIPINSQSYDGAVAAGISMACTFAGIGLSMGLEAAGLGEAQSVDATKVLSATTAGVVSNMKPNVARSGMFGQSAGYMGARTPFIIKRIPRQSLPEDFHNFRGYPSNITGTLGSLTGFAAIEDIQLNNVPAMEDERKEILDWLKGGVLI